MGLETVQVGARQADVLTINPNLQASTNAWVVVAGSAADLRPWRSLSYTIVVADASVNWEVFGANRSDYGDEASVKASAAVAAAGKDTYAVAQAPYSYYRIKIKSTVADTPGSAGVYGIAKG